MGISCKRLSIGVLSVVIVASNAIAAVGTAGVNILATDIAQLNGLAFLGNGKVYAGNTTSFIAPAFSQIDLANGTILSTVSSTAYPISLTYDPAANIVYSSNAAFTLCTVDLATGAMTPKSQSMPQFNFWDLEWEAATNTLWAATDFDQGSLYTVNTTTGAATLWKHFGTFAGNGGGIQSMAIGPDGQIYLAAQTSEFSGPDLWRVDRTTGEATLAIDLPFPTYGQLLTDLDYDAVSNRWIAVEDDRTQPRFRHYYVIELTGVPEPGAIAVVLMIAFFFGSRNSTRKTEMER